MDSKNHLISDVLMSEGTVNHTSIYIREVVKSVLDHSGISVILAHNHPSGDIEPSRYDIEITAAITHALNAISVRVQDHIIVGGHGIFSFREADILGSK